MLQKNSFFWFIFVIVLFTTHEKIFAHAQFSQHQQKTISIIYNNRWFNRPLHTLLTHSKWPSVFAGVYANSSISKFHINAFIKKYSLDVNEIENPLSSFKTFNQFFIRKLKPEARPLCKEKNAVISPADGAILAVEHIGYTENFPVKNIQFSLENFLKDKELAKSFEGGTAIIVRLAPWDYHRTHFPLSGTPSAATIIHGKYESVHPFVYAAGIQPLEVNERHLIFFESDNASTIALVPVGALFVGAIKETYTPGKPVVKGDEIGYFTFGGSTIVMLFKADTIMLSPEISCNSKMGIETPVKMGQFIAEVAH